MNNIEIVKQILGKISFKANYILETDAERQIVFDAVEMQIPVKPILKDHDHEEYFSKSVHCGNCGESIGSYSYGRSWCDQSKARFIKSHGWCNACGKKIDWSEVIK